MFKLCFFVIVFFIFEKSVSQKISCKNENGKMIDWFVNYKLPKLEDNSGLTGEGLAYAYLTSDKLSSKWTLSTKNISSTTSMMGYSLEDFYENPNAYTYLLYNDDNPGSDSTSVGHTKGIVVFGNESGIWIIHSIPKFPSIDAYSYPSNAIQNGQSILCISFETKTLNEIGKQLLYNHPSIYAKNLNIEGLDDDVKSLFSEKPDFIRRAPYTRVTKIKSKDGKPITVFAKDNQYNEDLYSGLIAPNLNSSLYVETWRRGSGTPFNPSCETKHKVLDVLSINLSINRNSKNKVKFSSTEDHSKWAIAMDNKIKWVCIGDINRMESQKKRGGGAACFKSSNVWQAFKSSINSTDNCSI